jgi:hypothetical protein
MRLRNEVQLAVRDRSFVLPYVPSADALPPHAIPSVERVGAADRVLAEIDQDGYAFAEHPLDAAIFNRRGVKRPRIRHEISVVLLSGVVCVRKRLVRESLRWGMREWLLRLVGLNFYTEAAALIRLKASDGAPRLIDIDLHSKTIYREFIQGERWAPATASLQAAQDLLAKINREGVVLLDLNFANILLGDKSCAAYWIDLEAARFREDWDWEERVKAQNRMLADYFTDEPRRGWVPALRRASP